MTTIINLTPHALTIEGVGTIEPSGTVARVATVRIASAPVGGIRITAQSLGDVVGLPAPADDTIYIVSGMVLEAVRGLRRGAYVFAPDTGADAIRDGRGQIVAVRGLVC